MVQYQKLYKTVTEGAWCSAVSEAVSGSNRRCGADGMTGVQPSRIYVSPKICLWMTSLLDVTSFERYFSVPIRPLDEMSLGWHVPWIIQPSIIRPHMLDNAWPCWSKCPPIFRDVSNICSKLTRKRRFCNAVTYRRVKIFKDDTWARSET